MSLRSGTQAGRASFKLFVHVGECRYGRGLRASGVRTPARNLTRSVSGRSAAAAAAPVYGRGACGGLPGSRVRRLRPLNLNIPTSGGAAAAVSVGSSCKP